MIGRLKLGGGRPRHQPDIQNEKDQSPPDGTDRLRLRPGDQVGRFTIVRGPIGGGSFGRVYIARGRGIHARQRVVLKVGDGSKENFLNAEARILRDITTRRIEGVVPWISPAGGNDPHALIGRHTIGDGTSIDYLVLGYAAGGDLQHLIQNAPNKRVARRDALSIVEQVATTLHALHAHGIIHHDLKPANILLAKPLHALGVVRPRALLTDLGAAIKEGEAGYVKLLTRKYTPPERIAGNHTLPASDIYALGRVLEDLVGGPSPTDDADIHELVGKMTQADPGSRPDARSVARELQRLQRESRSWFWMRRRFHWREMSELGIATILVCIMLAVFTAGGASASSELGLVAFNPGDGIFSFLSDTDASNDRANVQPTQTMIMPRQATATALAAAQILTTPNVTPIGSNARQTPSPANAQSFSAARPERTSNATAFTGSDNPTNRVTPRITLPGAPTTSSAPAATSASDTVLLPPELATSAAASAAPEINAPGQSAPETNAPTPTARANAATAVPTQSSRRDAPSPPTPTPAPSRITITPTTPTVYPGPEERTVTPIVYPGPETTAVVGAPSSGGQNGEESSTTGDPSETATTETAQPPVKTTTVPTTPPGNPGGVYPPPGNSDDGYPPPDAPGDGSGDRSTPEPIDEPTEPPADVPTDEPTDAPTDEPTDEPTDPPAAEEPTDPPADDPPADDPPADDPPADDPPADDPPADDPPADDPPADDDPGGDTGYP